jgi:hypothetical protein
VSYEARVAAARAPLHAGGAVPGDGCKSVVGRLAQFFPAASPVRLPVRVTTPTGATESSVLEYATSSEVLFASALPLDFGERLHLRNIDGTLDIHVIVIALQFLDGRMAVGARFAQPVANWIVKE